MTLVKRPLTPSTPLDSVGAEVFETECKLYDMRRDMTVLKRKLRDLKKARTLLKRAMPPVPDPAENDNW